MDSQYAVVGVKPCLCEDEGILTLLLTHTHTRGGGRETKKKAKREKLMPEARDLIWCHCNSLLQVQ